MELGSESETLSKLVAESDGESSCAMPSLASASSDSETLSQMIAESDLPADVDDESPLVVGDHADFDSLPPVVENDTMVVQPSDSDSEPEVAVDELVDDDEWLDDNVAGPPAGAFESVPPPPVVRADGKRVHHMAEFDSPPRCCPAAQAAGLTSRCRRPSEA